MKINAKIKLNNTTVMTAAFSAFAFLGLYKTVKDAGYLWTAWPFFSLIVLLMIVFAEYATVALVEKDGDDPKVIRQNRQSYELNI